MTRDICRKTILKTAGVSILAILFYTGCEENGVKVVTPEVRTFTDNRDGRTYKEVTIGEQRWMAENLKYAADGGVCYYQSWSHRTPEQNCEEYGRLYDWNAAMNEESSSNTNPSGVEGVCPVGWHLPSDAEWTELIDYVGINAGTKLKSRTFKGDIPLKRPDGTDNYRFSALDGPWASFWWSSTERESNGSEAWYRWTTRSDVSVFRASYDKHKYFLSVRCVHD